jgi:hypothetical protein
MADGPGDDCECAARLPVGINSCPNRPALAPPSAADADRRISTRRASTSGAPADLLTREPRAQVRTSKARRPRPDTARARPTGRSAITGPTQGSYRVRKLRTLRVGLSEQFPYRSSAISTIRHTFPRPMIDEVIEGGTHRTIRTSVHRPRSPTRIQTRRHKPIGAKVPWVQQPEGPWRGRSHLRRADQGPGRHPPPPFPLRRRRPRARDRAGDWRTGGDDPLGGSGRRERLPPGRIRLPRRRQLLLADVPAR